jgi:hypothetical protein
VDQIAASWNQLSQWLRDLHELRHLRGKGQKRAAGRWIASSAEPPQLRQGLTILD